MANTVHGDHTHVYEPGQKLLRRSLQFGRVLRANGIKVTSSQVMDFVHATQHIGIHNRRRFKEAAEACLVTRGEDREMFALIFDVFWRSKRNAQDSDQTPEFADSSAEAIEGLDEMEGDEGSQQSQSAEGMEGMAIDDDSDSGDTGDADDSELESVLTYSGSEALRAKDFSEYTQEELEQARLLMKKLKWEIGMRRSRRKIASSKGRFIDARRTMRKSLQTAGVPLRISQRKIKYKPRALIVICDISGSMDRYSRLLLQFIHTIENDMAKVEAFVFGTRLTRITRVLKKRPIDEAITRVSREVQDWAGGTRIGESIQTFNQEYARRVLRNGAVVLIISDGWDRGDPQLLGSEMMRLQRSSYRLIWLNPLLGSPRYQPLTRGMQAALPYIDDFLPVHNLESLELLADHLSSLGDYRPVRKQAPLEYIASRMAAV
ncbi:MAG TPA: VWA domain-containing protein [Thermomicrobiales bacterium]|nr:VWA domain-containing protein [Thermomicrobiales bacterium]